MRDREVDDVTDETEFDEAEADVRDYDDEFDQADEGRTSKSMLPVKRAALFVTVTAVVLTALVGWLGFRTYQSHHLQEQRALFLQVGRQGALNLTTIGWQDADSDMQRILTAATGSFYDDFSQRSQPFVDVLKKTQSTSVGTVTAAGLESSGDRDAQVLVAVSVQTTNSASPQPAQRSWRMRITVQKMDNDVKVSNVEFVA